MSKEIVKAIFDENIAGAREDLTFDAYFDSIKGNEDYKKGLFENYVSDGTKSYDEFNAETFGMGKPEAPSEIGGAESSPTESVSSEFEVGPPAGGTPPGVEPKGAPVAEAAALVGEVGSVVEPKQDVEPAVITKDSLLDVFTVEDEKNRKGWWEKVVDFFTGDNVRPERVFVSQEHYDSLKARQDEELKRAEKEAAETGESLDIVDVIQDFVTVTPEEYVAFAGAIQRGLLEAGIAEKVKIGEIPTRADIIEIARIKKEQGQIPSSKNYEKFNDEKTSFLEALEIFAKDPLEIGGQIVLESGAALARYGWDRALLGGGLGAAGGSIVPGIGTAAGGGMGLVAGMGVSGFSLGHASDILSSFQDAGVDLTDKYSLESAFSNKETIAKARDFALKRNVPILLFDLFSGGVAGRIVKAPAKSVIGKVAKETAELGVQSGLAGAGETAGQITAGQKFDPKSILSEMIGEVTTGVPEIAIGRAIDTKPSAHVAVGQMVEEKKAGKSVKAQAIKIDAPADVVKVMVDVSVGTGEIDAVQAGQIVQEYEQVQEVKKTIPEEFRNNEEIYSAIEEKKKLEEDKKTLDPVFTKGVDEKIAALDAKIEGIVSGREVVAADSVVAAEEVISPETGEAPKVEIIAKRRQKLNRDRTKLVPTGGFDYFAKVGDREVKLSDAEYKAYKDSGVLPESVSAVEVAPKVEGEVVPAATEEVVAEAVTPEVAQTPEVAEGQPAEVISPEVAEVLSTEDTTRIALESLEVLPEGIESAEEGARIYHEAIGKEERTEAEDAVVMAVEDAVIGGAVVAEETPIDYEVASSNVEETTKALGTKSAEKLNSVKEKISQAETSKFEDDERKQATTRTDRGVQEVQPTGERDLGGREVSQPDRILNSVSTGKEWERGEQYNGDGKVPSSNGKPVIPVLYHGHKAPFDSFSRDYRGTGFGNQGGGVFFAVRPAWTLGAARKSASGGYGTNQESQTTTPFVSKVKIKGNNFVFLDKPIPNDIVAQIGVINGIDPSKYNTYSAFLHDLVMSFVTDKKNFSDHSEAQTKASDELCKKGITGHASADVKDYEVVVYDESEIEITNQTRIYNSNAELISDQYHKAKADGSNPELVSAVDELLGKPAETPKAAETATPEEVSTEGVTPEVPGVVEAAEGQPSAETPTQPLTFKEKAKEAKQKADEALKEFDRLTEERRNTGEGISPFGRAERLSDLDRKMTKVIIDYLKFAAKSKAYSFADFISQLLERGIVVDYNNPDDRAFYEEHSGKKISEEQPKSIGITNAYDEAAREARGADPIAKKASTTNKQVWDDAMEITKRKDVPAQIAVWAAQDGFVDANPINQALILYDRIRIENEREILLKQIGGASDSQLVSIYERLAALEVETDLNETANKNLGRTWGVTGAFRQALADRAYTITGVIARAKAIGGKGLSAADEVRLANMAKEIELLQKQKAELEKKLSEELAKERVAAENKVMNEARRKPLPGTTTIEDVKSAYQKWLESKKATGIMFDPKSSAKADIEFLEVVLDYLKSQAINTISKVKKAVKDFTDGGLEVDDEGAAFILEELKARSEAEKPKKPAAKKKPATPKESSKKIEEKSTDELLSDISEKAEGQIDETNISSLRPYFAQVIRNEVANGAETLDQIVDKIYDKLLETIPSLTKADLKDAMSGYGQYRELSKEELDVKIREVKRIGRLEAALRDVEEKLELPKRTGVEQEQLSAKARALRQQILKAISDLGITPELTDEELSAKWQSARDAYKQRLENAIADVKLEIENKEKKQKKQPTEFNDQEIADLKASLKALREVRDNIPEIKANEADRKLSAKIEATKKKITEAERKIAEGDLSVEETEKLTSPELDALRQDLKGLNEQLSKMREDAKPEAQQISEAQARLDNAARREINRLEALRNKVLADGIGAEDVNAGEIATIKQKKKFPNLKRADALQTQIDNLRRAISDLIPEDVKQEALVQKYLATREKVLERLTKKYDNKEYETKTRPVPPASKEIAAVNRKINEKKKEIETDLERIRLRNRAMIEKLGGGLIDLMALAKSLIASVDLSAPFRQGIVYSVTEPKIFAKVFKDMFKFAFSEKNYQNWLNETKEDPRFDEYTSRYKLHISDQTGKMSAREEQFMSKFFGAFKKIPVYGQLLTGSERAYAGFINKLRWDVFQKYVEEVESMGLTKEEADVELKALAKFVNTATGRGELGMLSSAAVPLNSLLFSPKLVSSRLRPFMFPFLYSKMPKVARRKEAVTYLKFFGSIITTMVLLSFLMDEDKDEGIELDPRSSDFLKIRFQDYRVDPFGGYQQAIVAIAKLFGGVKSTKTGEVKNFSDEGFGQQTREDIIENYFTNKLAPVPATIYRSYIKPSPMDDVNNLYSALFGEVAKDQRSAMRKVGETIFDLTIPLYADDLVGVLSDPDVDLKTSVLAGSTIFGVGGGKYGGKTILRPGSEEFRVMKDMTVTQPRFDTEVKLPEYDVNSDGQIVKVLDEEGKEKKKFLTTSQTKEYNKMLRNTYSSFVNSIEEDFRDSLSDEEKKKLADFLLKKSKDIANWEYFASKIPSKGSDIKKMIEEMIDAEKDRIKGILSDGDSPYSFVFDAMSKSDNILTPKAIDPQENE